MSETFTAPPFTASPFTYTRRPLHEHRHVYRLRLYAGRLTAQCDCGAELDYLEIVRRINATG